MTNKILSEKNINIKMNKFQASQLLINTTNYLTNNIIFNKNNNKHKIASSLNFTNFKVKNDTSNIYYNDYFNDLKDKISKKRIINLEISKLFKNDNIKINKKMRFILFNWLSELSHKFKLKQRTICLCYEIIDRYCLNSNNLNYINKDSYQLLGVTALFISCKYEEVNNFKISHIEKLCCNFYNKEQILQCEYNILINFNYNFNIVIKTDLIPFFNFHFNFSNKEINFIHLLLEIMYLNTTFYSFQYECTVLGCFILICKKYKKNIDYNNLYVLFNIDKEEVTKFIHKIYKYYHNWKANLSTEGIGKKYSSIEYLNVVDFIATSNL